MNMSLNNFFLQNIAYCLSVKHRRPSSALYCDILINEKNIFSEIKGIIIQKEKSNLIYLFFLDKFTKECLEKNIFNRIRYKEFIEYFKACKASILDDYNTKYYMFQFVNFFHLIGTLRLLKDFSLNREEINSILLEILEKDEYHFLIKYSASQIFVCKDLGNENFEKNKILRSFYKNNLIKEVVNNKFFTKFIFLYSIYYNSFDIINENIKGIFNNILKNDKVKNVDFNLLHTYLPQIHSILYRTNKEKFGKRFLDNLTKGFAELYFYDKNSIENIRSLIYEIMKRI